MERKPQQQTLSIRISDTLREFLERAKLVVSNARGESVSTSDVAKILLESAKDDRLDFRLEVAELQQSATESLANIRKKWEHRHPLSRAEWIFLAQYIQVACEELSENPAMPSAEAFAILLEALLAVRSLRTDRGAGLDRYYLGNFEVTDPAVFNERQFDPETVPQVVRSLIQELRDNAVRSRGVFAGRNFYVALRDEVLEDLGALNHGLEPFLPTLFRLAARGHWIREKRPVRANRRGSVPQTSVPPATAGEVRLNSVVNADGEVKLALEMKSRRVIYPIGEFPQIREFAGILEQLAPGGTWDGVHFYAWSEPVAPDQPPEFQFLRRSDGVTLSFSAEEWETLKGLFSAVLAEPRLQPVLSELALVYGEI